MAQNFLLTLCASYSLWKYEVSEVEWASENYFYSDSGFSQFKASLDAEMKRLQSNGKGSKKRQVEALTIEEEELLWEKGLLGDRTQQTL